MTHEQYVQAVSRVEREQIVAAARSVKLHTTYFLKGVEE